MKNRHKPKWLKFLLFTLIINGINVGKAEAIRSRIISDPIINKSNYDSILDSVYLITLKNGKGFKYTPSEEEVALKISFKYRTYPIWTPSDSTIYDFEDSLNSIIKKYPNIKFRNQLNEYVRQYIGLTDTSGNKIMVILFNWVRNSNIESFGKATNYNSSLKIVNYNSSGLFVMLAYNIKDKKLISL